MSRYAGSTLPSVGRDELDGLEVSVDVLGEPEPVSDLSSSPKLGGSW